MGAPHAESVPRCAALVGTVGVKAWCGIYEWRPGPCRDFGPLAPLFRFETEDEVVAMANDTEFGLASYFYARDLGRVWRVAERLEYGMVGINSGIISTAANMKAPTACGNVTTMALVAIKAEPGVDQATMMGCL